MSITGGAKFGDWALTGQLLRVCMPPNRHLNANRDGENVGAN
jgi:hypothetical protein